MSDSEKDRAASTQMRILRTVCAGARAMLHVLLPAGCIALLLFAAASARGETGQIAGRALHDMQVLLLSEAGYGQPVPDTVVAGFVESLRSRHMSVNQIFVEYLDLNRNRDPEHASNLLALLRHKFANRRIDLIVAVSSGALEFLAERCEDLFPGAPVLTILVPDSGVDWKGTPRSIIQMYSYRDVEGTLRHAFDLFPKTRRLIVINGLENRQNISPAQIAVALARLKRNIDVEYTGDLTYEEMLQRVASPPPDTVILFGTYFSDRTGRSFIPFEVATTLAQRAAAPVFGLYDIFVPGGLIGGSVVDDLELGKRAGEVACNYLQGSLALDRLTTIVENAFTPVFNWRQIERWGGDASRLPENSVFFYRPVSLWDQYKTVIVGVALVFLLQVTLIAALLAQNRRRRKVEQTLRASEEKFSLAFRNAPYVLTISRAADGKFIEVNDSFSSITGFSREETLGFSVRDLGLWVDADERDGLVQSLLAGGEVLRREHRFRRKDGEIMIGLFSADLIQLHNEQCVLASVNDITDQKLAEEEREKLREQFHQAQKMESVGRLAGGVAHDFNNMLGIILGCTGLALEDADPGSPLYGELEEIRKAAERSANLTRQLLAFARKQTAIPRVLDLNETVEGMLKMLRRLIGEDISLSWQPEEGVWPVMMDPSQIDQILANLCVNARDAIDGVGNLTIRTENVIFDEVDCRERAGFSPGQYVLLLVSDDGSGMDPETLKNVFEPFFTTKSVGKGTGLGLSTVYGIVRQNDGFVNVYSEPGLGSTFRIYLPRYESEVEKPPKEAPQEPVYTGSETILLVEDDPSVLRMTGRMLERQGYRVIAAGTPSEALRLAEAHSDAIHLLMTDVVMPEMNGLDLARKILERHPGLKQLFVSGYTADIIARQGMPAEGFHFIQKPLSSRALASKLREILGTGEH